MSDLWPASVTLEDVRVRLEPLDARHARDLAIAVTDGDLFKRWWTRVPTPAEVPSEIERRLALRRSGKMLPFAVIDRASGSAVDMTTYCNIDAVTPRVEIGYTFYARRFHRTGFNASYKRLLLGYAFDSLGCVAVEFRTHSLNHDSRRAIERLGAKLDGILRSYDIARNGTLRDLCVYSIVASEWPAARALLEYRLAARARMHE